MVANLDTLERRLREAASLVSAWVNFKYERVPVGLFTFFPDRDALELPLNTLQISVIANLYSLFDPQGLDVRKILGKVQQEAVQNLLVNYIKPMWNDIGRLATPIRHNLGHHIPHNIQARAYAERALLEVPFNKILAILILIDRCLLFTSEKSGHQAYKCFTLHPLPELNYQSFDTVSLSKLEEHIKVLIQPNQRRPTVGHILKWGLDHIVLLPIVLLRNRSRENSNYCNLSPNLCHELDDRYFVLRDQFLATNALFLSYYTHRMWFAFPFVYIRKPETTALIFNWYSHICTLFENRETGLPHLFPIISEQVPFISRFIYESSIERWWKQNGNVFRKFRNRVGFHRNNDPTMVKQSIDKMNNGVDGRATIFLMSALYSFFRTIEEGAGRRLETIPVPYYASLFMTMPHVGLHRRYYFHQFSIEKMPFDGVRPVMRHPSDWWFRRRK